MKTKFYSAKVEKLDAKSEKGRRFRNILANSGEIMESGEIRELETEKVLGYHDGAVFYTLGQRHGLYVGGGLPYYVVKKDLARNIVYVSKNLNAADLWTKEIELENLFFREKPTDGEVLVRLRHRAPLIPAKFEDGKLIFEEEVKRVASGQSAVIYQDEVCLGGGIIQ